MERSPSSFARAAVPAAVAWALLVLALAALAPAPADGQEVRPRVVEVTFEGNETFSSDSLAGAIVTRPTRCRSTVFLPLCWFGADFAVEEAYLPRRELPRDRLRLQIWYQRRGFRQASVDTTLTEVENGVRVGFRIDEGRPVRVDSVEFVGDEEVLTDDILGGLPLQPGDRLSTLLLDASRDTITRRLTNRGYARAAVLRSWFIPTDDPYSATVTYDVAPGPLSRFGHISVSGNENLSEGTVLRTVQFRSGQLYRANQVVEAQARLFGLGIVRSASVTPRFDAPEDSVIPVDVRIREGDPRRVRAGAGLSSSECFDVDGRWVSRNFQGAARRLQLRGRVSNLGTEEFGDLLCPSSGEGEFARVNWLVSAELNQPWIFSTRNSFQASVFAERQSLPDVFVRKAVGATLALTRAIGPRTPLTLSYAPELSKIAAAEILFCTSLLVCAPEDVAILQSANWLAPVGLNFTRDVSNNVLNPSRGYRLTVDLEHAAAWTGSEFRYDRAIVEGSWYEQVDPAGAIVAAGARAGWVGSGGFEDLVRQETAGAADVVPPEKRFYAGGANSVRGFAQNRLGPRVLFTEVTNLVGAGCDPTEIQALSCDASIVDEGDLLPRPTGGSRVFEGSLELRVPLSSNFQAAAFGDFGQLWQDQLENKGLEVTPGLGVRYLSPIGPLRLDVAYRFRGGEALPVVTPQLVDYDPAIHDPDDRIQVGGERLPYVEGDQLAILEPRVLYGADPSFWQRLQIHFSIGQAF